jgi:murein DD-endopeptidase MepM/ murein hydrolase activator NlpD
MFKTILKQKTNRFGKFFSAVLIAAVFVLLGARPSVLGQSADDLQQQKDAKQQELQTVEQKINDYQGEIKTAQGQANTLNNQIKIINLQIAQTQAQIQATEDQIDAANLEIADVTDKIVQTEQGITDEKTILKSMLAEINDLDERSPLEIALENDNFAEFLNQVQYITSIQQESQDALTKIKQLQADLDIRQADLKTQKSNLDVLLSSLDQTNTSLSNQQNSKQQLLDETKGQERAYQKLLVSQQVTQKQLQDEINNLDNQISAKLGNSKLKPIHGLLAYPMQGVLTQGYGNTGFTALGYSFHNGIDIAAPAGTPIYAAGDGVVVATGHTTASGADGAYGNWVAIKHDQGKFANSPIITLYGHMSSFRMTVGQQVKMGDLVGFEGNTGNTTAVLYGPHRGYHLHFTVFDARGFGVAPGAYPKIYGGTYQVPYGATYSPLDFL